MEFVLVHHSSRESDWVSSQYFPVESSSLLKKIADDLLPTLSLLQGVSYICTLMTTSITKFKAKVSQLLSNAEYVFALRMEASLVAKWQHD